MSAAGQRNYFVHSLLRAHNWQHRPQLDGVCDWWRLGGRGVCALVGMGGAGKTAVAERFLHELLDDTSPKRQRGKQPQSVLVYSFYEDDKPENFFRHVQIWLEGDSAPDKPKSPTQLMFDIQQHQGFIILDGLEMVQEGVARGGFGKLTSPSLRDLLNHIACGAARDVSVLVTTRFPLTDLRDSKPRFFHTIPIDDIDVAAGIALLRSRGVRGSDVQLAQVVEHCGRHALTVDLAGGYINVYGNGDPSTPLNLGTAEELQAEADQEPDDDKRAVLKQRIRFERIAQRYREAMLENDEAALALLERICLFRLGVDCETLGAIFTGPGAEKVSSKALASLSIDQLQKKLDWLVRMRIVEAGNFATSPRNSQVRYTIHPAVSGGFLGGISRNAARECHEAIRRRLEFSLGDAPRNNPSDPATLDLLEEIIHHALATKNVQSAWDIYQNRLGGCKNLIARLGDYPRARRMTKAILVAIERGEPLSEPSIIILRSDFGFCSLETGNIRDAIESLSDGLNLCLSTNNSNLQVLASNLSCAQVLSGHLREALATLNYALGELRQPKAVLDVLTCIAEVELIRGTPRVVISEPDIRARTERAIPESVAASLPVPLKSEFLSDQGYLDEIEELIETTCNQPESRELASDNRHSKRRSDLDNQTRPASARTSVSAAREWAIERDGKEILCRCAVAISRIEASLQRDTERSDIDEKSENWLSANRIVAEGLKIARDCGFGLFHIDLLLARAWLHLVRGDADAALKDIEVALDTGIPANEETGQPELLAANHPACGYTWAIPVGLQLRAEALLLKAAEQIGAQSFVPEGINEAPSDVAALIDQAKTLLHEALDLWQPLHDPEPERDDQNFQLDGKQYNYKAAETYRVLERLNEGLLTVYPLKPEGETEESVERDMATELADEPSLIPTEPVDNPDNQRPRLEPNMDKCKILFLAANPTSTTQLALNEELRSIQSRIRESAFRDSVELTSRWALRPDDLELALLEIMPHVVHFSGHGSDQDELILQDDSGQSKPVSKGAIIGLFRILKDNLRLVVLNACFSQPQAEGIVETIDCAIGMNKAIGDEAAIKFAASLYRGIGFGRTIQESFELGKNALMREGIPEEDTPELLSHRDADPKEISLVSPQ